MIRFASCRLTRALVATLAAHLAAGAAAATTPAVVPQDPAVAGIPVCKDMQKTASGLEWGVLVPGREEPGPGPRDVVLVHYTGWLADGTKFDSSRDRDQPQTCTLDSVIHGWTEALQLMTPGARCKLVVPGNLGFGAEGAPGARVPPNATLVFDIELLKVTPMPKLRPAGKPDAQQTTASGVQFELVEAGTGAVCGAKDGLSMRYAIWRAADGELMDCSERQRDHRITGTPDSLPFPFLQELVLGRKVGDILRAVVPKQLFPNVDGDSIWELELTGVWEIPDFRPCDPNKIVTTQSGLVYEVITMGSGTSPKATDTVVVNFTGWLTDGTVVDGSFRNGGPLERPLNRVIRGWTEGLQLMKPGGKFLFTIPGDLAYGPRGSPPNVPANATLVFLVELVAVKPR